VEVIKLAQKLVGYLADLCLWEPVALVGETIQVLHAQVVALGHHMYTVVALECFNNGLDHVRVKRLYFFEHGLNLWKSISPCCLNALNQEEMTPLRLSLLLSMLMTFATGRNILIWNHRGSLRGFCLKQVILVKTALCLEDETSVGVVTLEKVVVLQLMNLGFLVFMVMILSSKLSLSLWVRKRCAKSA